MSEVQGVQVNYRQYLIKKQDMKEDGIKVFYLESNTNPFYLMIEKDKFELLDSSKRIIETGTTKTIKWLGLDLKPGVQ